MSKLNLSERMRELIVFATDEYRRYKQLEITTGIQADTWKSWFHGRQRPTVEMIESAGKQWPQYAFWLTTGFTDIAHGHIAPEGFEINEIKTEIAPAIPASRKFVL